MISRLIGVARVRADTFLDLKQDRGRMANGEALLVAVLVGVSLGVGDIILFDSFDIYSIISSILSSVALVLLATAFWSGLVFLIGTRIFKGTTDFLGLARPVFFSLTPGLLFMFASAPTVREIVSAALSVWIVVINVFVAKQVMNLTTQRSILTIIISTWIMIFAGGTLGIF